MNYRRGLFRLWIVGTTLFVLAIAVISYGKIKKQFEDNAKNVLLVAKYCGEARGRPDIDYSTEKTTDFMAKPNAYAWCWYTTSKFRELYPEHKDLSESELSDKFYAKQSLPDLPNPWATLGSWANARRTQRSRYFQVSRLAL
jgi:hypothetical protein